eukprot:c7441_g1_i1.p1 GENE.c7441_g1_i1~~c7441_g1_i1.p1  ORF type:complete len:259 (-),score=106.20 c7441_g1_i1:30-806(-)
MISRTLISFLFVIASISALQTGVKGGMNISSLTINAGENKESRIVLGDSDSAFTVAVGGDGSFVIRNRNEPTFSIDADGKVTIAGSLNSKGAMRIDGKVNFNGVEQWLLVALENFNLGATGWSNSSTTTCGNPDKMILGGCGKFANGEVSKTYFNLPAHDVIRVKANYHFIDKWGGETAYAKLQDQYVWTDSFDSQATKSGIDICCSPAPESKYSTPIDVTLPHSDTTLKVAFGSTLTLAPTEQSWGISDVQVYVRKN